MLYFSYRLFAHRLNYQQAEAFCVGLGGRLASVESISDNEQVKGSHTFRQLLAALVMLVAAAKHVWMRPIPEMAIDPQGS